MNRYAIIENGVVTNVVVSDANTAAQNGWIQCDHGGPGWIYANGVFTEPTPIVRPAALNPTKEELLAQLQALQQQIQSLG